MENPKEKVKKELSELFDRLEHDFNPEDETRLLELREQHLTEPEFFREWMMYDRLLVGSVCEEHKLAEAASENISAYISLKYAPEDKEFYQKELQAWKEANGIE